MMFSDLIIFISIKLRKILANFPVAEPLQQSYFCKKNDADKRNNV